jgi:S1 RNA binding domain protein
LAEIGSVQEGKVSRLTDYGAFVQLENGETGLVHISEVDINYVRSIRDHLREGDTVSVKVIAVKDDGKIDLSIKQADPAFEEANKRSRQGRDPEFEAKLKKFMHRSQEHLAELRRQGEGKKRR